MPKGSSVYLDSIEIGNSPLKKRVKSGIYLIEIKKDGYQIWSKEIKLSPKRKTTLRIKLQKIPKKTEKNKLLAATPPKNPYINGQIKKGSPPNTPPPPPKLIPEKKEKLKPKSEKINPPTKKRSDTNYISKNKIGSNTLSIGNNPNSSATPKPNQKPPWNPQKLGLPKKMRIRIFLIDPRGIAGLQYTLDLLQLSKKIERNLQKMIGPKYRLNGVTKSWRAFIRERAKASNSPFWTVYPRAVAYIIYKQTLRGRSINRISQILVKYERLNKFKRYINK